MKTKLYTAIAILSMAFGMTACSSSDDLDDGGNNSENNGKTQYMAVSIVTNTNSSVGAKTRADNEQGNNGTYHDGTNSEGAIGKTRFYFFGQDGTPAYVQTVNGQAVNYVDYTFEGNGDTGNESTTVERKYAQLILDPVGSNVPSQVVAIANYDALSNDAISGTNGLNGKSLTGFLTSSNMSTTPYENFYNTTDKNNFAMSSSVYTDDSNSMMCAVSTAGYIFNTQQEANQHPLSIYVERIGAKVLAGRGGTASNWIKVKQNSGADTYSVSSESDALDAYILSTGTNTDYAIDGVTQSNNYRVIAVINGWGLADEYPNAYVVKNINGYNSWTSNLLGFAFSWSTAHRSFWETVPEYSSSNPLKNHTWEQFTSNETTNTYNHGTQLNDDNTSDNAKALYTLPNTPTSAADDNAANYAGAQTMRTKLLVAATIMYSTDGGSTYTPATIYQFRNTRYINLSNALRAMIGSAGSGILIGDYNESSTENDKVEEWATPTEGDVSLVNTADNLTGTDQLRITLTFNGNFRGTALQSGHHAVYAQGTITGGNTPSVNITNRWYNQEGVTDNGLSLANQSLNSHFGSNALMVYNEGRTYYYTTIQHLTEDASKLGHFGVVRNHEYRINIKSLGGFGTPVYDPKHVIVPVKPTDTSSYMAAEINVLQWRVVNQNVDLNTNPSTSAKKH